jgi:hypothetical protein
MRPPLAGVPAPTGPAGIPQPVPAAGQLLSAMFQPQVQQALMAMLLGQLGTRTVPIGAAQVPVAAIPNMLGALASRAAAQYHESVGPESDAALVAGFSESEDPQERADELLTLLQQEAERYEEWDGIEEGTEMSFEPYETVLDEFWVEQ